MHPTLYITNRKDWRAWLEDNYAQEKEIWLIYYKKHTGTPRIPYDDAVEEALCFGWIDSIVKRIDEEKYMQKFTPRKDKSEWSELNKKRVKKLIKQGLMAQPGLEKIEIAKKNGCWKKAVESARPYDTSIELEQALSRNKRASTFFHTLPPSYQKQYITWVASAKKEETRRRRAKEAISLLLEKKKLSQK